MLPQHAPLPSPLSWRWLCCYSVGGSGGDGQVIILAHPWLETLGLNLSLRLDGLGFLFALMILVIGLLVILYASYYLSEREAAGRFFALLLLFMGAMLGVVLSENLLLLLTFLGTDQPVVVPADRFLGQS